MGGLVLGLCLKKYAPDVHFDIYEAAAELAELGAGISMSPRTWSMIKELGLVDELLPTTGTQAPTGTLLSIFISICTLLSSDDLAAGNPLVFRKGDEDPAVDVFELPQREYNQLKRICTTITEPHGIWKCIRYRDQSYNRSSPSTSAATTKSTSQNASLHTSTTTLPLARLRCTSKMGRPRLATSLSAAMEFALRSVGRCSPILRIRRRIAVKRTKQRACVRW